MKYFLVLGVICLAGCGTLSFGEDYPAPVMEPEEPVVENEPTPVEEVATEGPLVENDPGPVLRIRPMPEDDFLGGIDWICDWTKDEAGKIGIDCEPDSID